MFLATRQKNTNIEEFEWQIYADYLYTYMYILLIFIQIINLNDTMYYSNRF